MVHTEELRLRGCPVKKRAVGGRHGSARRTPLRRVARSAAAMLAATAVLAISASGCDGPPVAAGELRFAQVGEIQVDVRSPVAGGTGRLDEAFLWRSDGPWVFVERLSYEGRHGDETIRRPDLNPGDLAPEYGSLVRQLWETPGLTLFSDEVPQDLVPQCDPPRSRVTVTLRDLVREEEVRWIRCADGTFFTVTPGSAGPDAGASRVVTAAQLARFFTLGDGPRSSYLGSVPFASIERGEDSPAHPLEPAAFRSNDGTVPPEWEAFWEEHAGPDELPPVVDWENEMVLLAAVGARPEAGESVKIQRILPVEGGTRIELVQTVPGDFCSPAAREIHPFHLVVTPRRPAPLLFNAPLVDRVPCG